MIYTYQILKQLRIAKQYNANAIAKKLRLSSVHFKDYESRPRPIAIDLLGRWLDELDITITEHPWYTQKHERECAYLAITSNLIYQINHPQGKELIAKLADVLVFSNSIDISLLCAQIQKHTLPHILPRPRSADIVMDHIKDSDK